MTVINTNVGALTARTYAMKANDSMQDAMERLSSGLRINSAADDAAGLAVANKMESQLRGMNVAIRNSQDGISLVQTAESGMSEISNMVVRMRELAVQMNNGVYTTADRKNAQLEVTALLAEIDKIAGNTAFNDVKVLDGTYVKDIRAGNTNAESISVAIDAMDTASMGGAVVTTGVKTVGTGTNTTSSSAVDVSVIVAGNGEDFILDRLQLSSDIRGKTGGYFAIEPFTNASVASKFSIVASGVDAGDISMAGANKLEAGESYVFNVVYKSTADDSVLYTDKVSITATDYAPAPSTSTKVTLTVEEAQDISLTPTNVMSDRFKEFVSKNPGGTYTLGTGNDEADFSIVGSTGVISKGSASGATFDFENPLDGNTDNSYVLDVTYTDTRGAVFTEQVTLNITDNAANDAAVIGNKDSVLATTGASAYSVNTDTANGATAKVIDLVTGTLTGFSQGFQDYITNNTVDGWAVSNGAGGAAPTGVSIANTDELTIAGNMAAGTHTFELKISDSAKGTEFKETVTLVVADVDSTGGDDASGVSTLTATASSNYNTGVTTVFGSNTTSGGEPVIIDLNDMLTNGTANNGFADLKAFATANGTSGTFTFGTGTNVGAAAGVAIPTGTNGTAGATDAGKLVLAQPGDYGTTGKNAIEVTYVAGGKTFTQKVELDWTAGVTQATDAAGPNTVAFSSVLPLDGSSTTELIGGKSTLSVVEARQAKIISVGTNAVLSAGLATFVGNHTKGTYSLSGTDAASFSVNEKSGEIESVTKMDFESKASYDFNLVYTKGAKVYTETIALSVTNDEVDDVTHVADIDMSTAEGAASAVTVLDIALNTISSAQAKLGAIQNRLQHNIDNLSMASMLTETARGRIVDADFARETSELSKQQILGQAATSMLAQANQSKQSVLALLQ